MNREFVSPRVAQELKDDFVNTLARLHLQLIPLFWSKNPRSKRWRYFAAQLASSHYYKTVEILFEQTLALRRQLGGEFERLQVFLLRWAAVRSEINFLSNGWKLPVRPQVGYTQVSHSPDNSAVAGTVGHTLVTDPKLGALINAWVTLPVSIRAAMMALVNSHR